MNVTSESNPAAHGNLTRGESIRAGRKQRRPSVFTVVGETILTAGVLVLLFVLWQNWFNDLVVGSAQNQSATEVTQVWSDRDDGADHSVNPPTTPTGPEPSEEEPPVLDLATTSGSFAVLIIPRFGEGFARTISEGVGSAVLSSRESGVGHYSGTQAPGEIGNFAIAAHRTTYGRSFHNIDQLQTGDHIFVETVDGWYRYVYRNSEYVLPTGVGVLAPLPQYETVTPGERVLTMTSCNPLYSAAERIIAYAVMDAWFPRSGGIPAELTTTPTGETS
jgi:sortase A